MALFTFSGGVHPADGKEFAKNSPITEYLPKGDVVLPLGQHIGAPAPAPAQHCPPQPRQYPSPFVLTIS